MRTIPTRTLCFTPCVPRALARRDRVGASERNSNSRACSIGSLSFPPPPPMWNLLFLPASWLVCLVIWRPCVPRSTLLRRPNDRGCFEVSVSPWSLHVSTRAFNDAPTRWLGSHIPRVHFERGGRTALHKWAPSRRGRRLSSWFDAAAAVVSLVGLVAAQATLALAAYTALRVASRLFFSGDGDGGGSGGGGGGVHFRGFVSRRSGSANSSSKARRAAIPLPARRLPPPQLEDTKAGRGGAASDLLLRPLLVRLQLLSCGTGSPFHSFSKEQTKKSRQI